MIRETKLSTLSIGNAFDARDLQLLYDNQITAVVDVAYNEKPAQLGRDLIYCRFPLNDGGGNSVSVLETSIRATVWLLRGEHRTLIACSAGMSRSPSIAAAALSVYTGRAADECLAEITDSAPHDVSPVLWADIRRVCQRLHQGDA